MAIFCKKLMVRSANSEPESTPLVSYFYTMNVCPMLRRALWENMKILQSSKLARLQVFLFVLPCLS